MCEWPLMQRYLHVPLLTADSNSLTFRNPSPVRPQKPMINLLGPVVQSMVNLTQEASILNSML